MRKFVKSASIILSALLVLQFMLSDISYAQRVNTTVTEGTKILNKSDIKAKVPISPKQNTKSLVAQLAATEPINSIPSDNTSNISPNTLTVDSISVQTQDSTPPTVPQKLSYKAISQNSIELNWSPSTDDCGTVSYAVYRDDSMIATVTGSAIYLDSGLLPDITYKYKVAAFDASNNYSAKSNTLTAMTKTQNTTENNTTDNSIKVQMYNANRSATNNTIFPWYKIYNTGTVPVSLADIKIRYYYTINGEKDQNFWCDWSDIGSSKVTGTFAKMLEKKNGADSYLEIGFKNGAKTLEPGDSIELQCRIAKTDWTNYDQSDDYSFDSNSTGYTDSNKVTGYNAGTLIWGNEPQTETPTDITPPAVPLNLTSYSISTSEVGLNWAPSSDDTRLSGYIVYRNSVEIAKVNNGTSYTDTGLLPDTIYTYEVAAYDFANNVSQKSQAVSTKAGENINTAIKLQMYNTKTKESSNTIYPRYKIFNIGNVPVNLADIKVRYYYTINGEKGQNFWCDWSNIGGSNVVGIFKKMSEKKKGADTYLEIGFKNEAGILEPGNSIELHCRIAKTDWTDYDQADDYSFDSNDKGYTDWNKVTVYNSSTLIWGNEPGTETPADITPPTVPMNLTSYSISNGEVGLAWAASTDDTGVSGYIVYRNGIEIARVGETTSYTDTGLSLDTLYTYEISAYDYANNISGKSQAVSTKTGENINTTIKLQMYNTKTKEFSNTIYLRYMIYNTGNVSVRLEDIKVRYYYTINGEKDQNFWCDWSNIGDSNVIGSFIKMPAVVEGVDYCLEISFKSGAGVLEPGKSAELHCRIAKINWTNYNQLDDYSFITTGKDYTDWNKVTGYVDGKLVWGIEPIVAPQNINVTTESKSITLSWDTVPCATSYEVEVDGVIVDNGLASTYTHEGLIPGTKHIYRVRAKNQIMLSPWSSYLSVITLLDKPSNVIKEVTETQINMSWDEVEGALSYDLEIDGSMLNNGTKTNYVMENLNAGTLHTIRIRAKGADIDGEWTDLLQLWTLPNTPTNIHTTSLSTSITLTWDEVNGASSYDVEVYGTAVDNGKSTSYTHTELEPNTQRTYRVRAKNPSGVSGWSDVISATTLPGTAFNLQVQAQDSSLKVTWDAQAGALAYELEIDGTQILELSENTYLHTGLTTNTEHTYRVRSKNIDGVSDWSQIVKGIVLPFVPGNFSVATVSSSAITLIWDEVTGATGYDIEIDGKVFDIELNTTYAHTELKPNEEHIYRVRAKNGTTAGVWTQEIRKTTLLPAPTNLKATAAGDQISLQWDMVIGADSYEVEIDGKILNAGSSTEYVQAEITPGLTYTFRVRAINENGQGDWSALITKAALLGKPANVTATSNSDSITITWSVVEGATAYDVMVDGTIVDNADSTTYQHKGLSPNSMHVYRVRARNTEYTGEWSDIISAFTKVGIPANVQTFAISTVISVTWDDVDGADSYDISVDGKIINNGSSTIYKHTQLSPNTKHSYRVRAKNENGEGSWSNTVIQLTGPAVPKNIKADAKINEIALTWDKVEGAVSYEVEVDGEIIKDILIESYLSKGLEPNTRHEYRVRAKNTDGVCSEWSELLEVNTKDELIIKVDKDTGFNFVVAVPKKDGVDSYDIVVNYNPDDVDVIDLYANTQKLDLETGKIEGTSLSIKQFSDGKIVFGVDAADKSVIAIIRFMSKTNNETKMSYTME